MVQGVVGRVPGGTGVGEGELPVVQGVVGRVPGGTGVRK